MRLRLMPAACGMLVFAFGIPAYGGPCYQIWDSRDTLVYQSVLPPFDLARPGFDRAMANLRAQRRTFIFFDTQACAITGSGLTGPQSQASRDPASILDIRGGFDSSVGRGSGGMLSPTPATTGPAPVSAPQVGTNIRPSGGTSMGSSGRY